ncbi:response regulator [Massilia sp. H-1]|nr:response regulator [Massilia sp. H-1]
MALSDLLSGYDMFDLVEADDGEAAWTLLEDGLAPVICFCDVRMPRMSGLELLQKIKAHPALATLPFVLVSSASDRDTVLQAVKLGAVGYLLKPLLPNRGAPAPGKDFPPHCRQAGRSAWAWHGAPERGRGAPAGLPGRVRRPAGPGQGRTGHHAQGRPRAGRAAPDRIAAQRLHHARPVAGRGQPDGG